MPAIIITTDQKDQVDRIGVDADVVQYSGVDAPGQSQYIPLSVDYVDAVDNGVAVPGADPIPGAEIKTATIDGSKSLAASIVKNISTDGASVYSTSPSFVITGATPITVGTLNITFASSRKVLITLNGSCYSTSINTGMDFRVSVGGADIGIPLKFFFNTAFQHSCFSGGWVTTVQAGANTILAKISRTAGGHITLDSNDFINISVIG